MSLYIELIPRELIEEILIYSNSYEMIDLVSIMDPKVIFPIVNNKFFIISKLKYDELFDLVSFLFTPENKYIYNFYDTYKMVIGIEIKVRYLMEKMIYNDEGFVFNSSEKVKDLLIESDLENFRKSISKVYIADIDTIVIIYYYGKWKYGNNILTDNEFKILLFKFYLSGLEISDHMSHIE